MNRDSFTFRSFEISTSFYEPIRDERVSSETPTSPLFTSSPNPANSNRKHNSTISPGSHRRTCHTAQRSNSSSVFNLPQKENLRVLTINCQSLQKKRADLEATIKYVKPDIVCGCESWLNSNIRSSEVFPSDYVAYRKDRVTATTGGGVFLLVHKDIISTEEPTLDTDCEILWARIQLKGKKELLVGSFYMPHRKEEDIHQLERSLQQTADRSRPKQVLLCGDFNCPDIEWDTGIIPPGVPDRHVQQALIESTETALLTQVHAEPTRGNSVLDLVFTTNPTLVKHSSSVPGISDHAAVVTDFETRVFYQKQKPRKIHLFAKTNWDGVKTDLSKMVSKVQELYIGGSSVEDLWTTFRNGITAAMDCHVPSKMCGRVKNNIPWLGPDVRRLLKRKKRLFKKAKKTGKWENYKFVQKQCRRKLRKAEWEHINGTITDGLKTNNSKPFWAYVKSKKQDSMGVAPLMKKGCLVSEAKAKAEILIDQFQSVFTREDSAPLPTLNPPLRPDVPDINVDTNGVLKQLRELKPAKASGPDQIPNIILKNCAETLAPALRDIFQLSLDSGQLPADWRKANVSCAFKKGDKHQAENYRPISLTSVCCKVLEHIVCSNLLAYFDKHQVLTDLNHGFRAGFSCETQLVTTLHDMFSSFDSNTQVDLAVLDFSKAFDTVPHSKLLHKLNNFGVKGTTLKWITNFLTNRTMRVVLEGESSKEVPVDSGVPQGTVLGPLLFLCHINDLPAAVKSQVRLFADDTLLYRQIRTFADHLALQEDLRKLEAWAHDWGMRFNAKKCNIISIKKKSDFRYQLCGEILREVDSTVYLGVTISKDLKWHAHISNTTRKANYTFGFLRRNLRFCPRESKKTAYVALVRSTLEYATAAWDPHQQGDIDKLERIQRRAARFLTGDYRTRKPGSVSAMLDELHLSSLEDRRRERRLSLMFRVVEGLVPALPIERFVQRKKEGRRKVKPKRFADFVTTNIVEKFETNNSKCFIPPEWKADQSRNSFFHRTVLDWNKLTDTQVQAKTQEEFRLETSGLRV